jgi:hypothetical protein
MFHEQSQMNSLGSLNNHKRPRLDREINFVPQAAPSGFFAAPSNIVGNTAGSSLPWGTGDSYPCVTNHGLNAGQLQTWWQPTTSAHNSLTIPTSYQQECVESQSVGLPSGYANESPGWIDDVEDIEDFSREQLSQQNVPLGISDKVPVDEAFCCFGMVRIHQANPKSRSNSLDNSFAGNAKSLWVLSREFFDI